MTSFRGGTMLKTTGRLEGNNRISIYVSKMYGFLKGDLTAAFPVHITLTLINCTLIGVIFSLQKTVMTSFCGGIMLTTIERLEGKSRISKHVSKMYGFLKGDMTAAFPVHVTLTLLNCILICIIFSENSDNQPRKIRFHYNL